MKKVIDQQQRESALDPNGSFIVQAPAGSGKTETLQAAAFRSFITARIPKPDDSAAAVTTMITIGSGVPS